MAQPKVLLELLLSVLVLLAFSQCEAGNANRMKRGPFQHEPSFEWKTLKLPDTGNCGRSNFRRETNRYEFDRRGRGRKGQPSARIASGIDVTRLGAPFLVQVFALEESDNAYYGCSGVIVSTSIVLTHAACLRNRTDPWVVAGWFFVKTPQYDPDAVFEKRYSVKYYCTPQDWNEPLVMLVLDEPLKDNPHYEPACMVNWYPRDPFQAWSFGFGQAEFKRADGTWKQFHTKKGRALDIHRCLYFPQKFANRFDTAVSDCFLPTSYTNGSWCEGDMGGPVIKFAKEDPPIANLVGMIHMAYNVSCKEGEAYMENSFPMKMPYFLVNYISRWIGGDDKAYHNECFKPYYKVPTLHYQAFFGGRK